MTYRTAGAFVTDAGKQLLSIITRPEFLAMPGLNKALKVFSIGYALAATPQYAPVDQIARGFFERNNIPVSFEVTMQAQRDTVAHAVLYAQMSATQSFILEYAWYFLTPIWGSNRGNNTNTLHNMDQWLLSSNRTINGLVGEFERALIARYGLTGYGFNIARRLAELRGHLNDFEMRANYINMRFLATIANAACGVLSNIEAVPPVISNASDQVTGQALDAMRQLHSNAQQARNRARDAYQNLSDFARPERRDEMRTAYEEANNFYIEISNMLGERPTGQTLRPARG